jgi:hypothetical protein
MQLSLVMIQTELADEEIGAIYADVGYRECEVVGAPIPGVAVLGLVDDERARDPRGAFLRHCIDQGWTVIADESGHLATTGGERWARLARTRACRVVVLHGEPDPGMRAFAVYHGDPCRAHRAVAVSGDEREEIGEPMAIEQAFRSRWICVDDLITLVSSFGLDFERLNLLPHYTVTRARPPVAC